MRALISGLILAFGISGLATADAVADGGFVLAKGKRFFAEVARTPAEHARGLMYRTSLKSDRCMFFVYSQESYHAIWMKNCYIALDVAWIDAGGKVVEIETNIPPCSPMRGDDCPNYGGNVLSRHFIEFPVGTIKRIGLKVGDKVGWDLQFSNGGTSIGGLPITDKSPLGNAKPKSTKPKTGSTSQKK